MYLKEKYIYLPRYINIKEIKNCKANVDNTNYSFFILPTKNLRGSCFTQRFLLYAVLILLYLYYRFK